MGTEKSGDQRCPEGHRVPFVADLCCRVLTGDNDNDGRPRARMGLFCPECEKGYGFNNLSEYDQAA